MYAMRCSVSNYFLAFILMILIYQKGMIWNVPYILLHAKLTAIIQISNTLSINFTLGIGNSRRNIPSAIPYQPIVHAFHLQYEA